MSIKISIITVTFNADKNLVGTLKSIFDQDYVNKEIIIVDGGSTDKTIELIKNVEGKISCWISEKDGGIYDAMNKGMLMATGEYICFLNAGDEFYSVDAMSRACADLYDADIVYGKTAIIDKQGNVCVKEYYPPSLDWKVIPYCHQSVFIKKNILLKNSFDLSFKIAADYNQYFQLKKQGFKFKAINLVVSKYDTEGFSSKNYVNLLKEYQKIALLNYHNRIDRFKIRTYFTLKQILAKF